MIQGEVTFSEQIRSQTKAAWDAAIGHRFFRKVAGDTTDDRILALYLKIEYGFVDCAAAALGYAVAQAFTGHHEIEAQGAHPHLGGERQLRGRRRSSLLHAKDLVEIDAGDRREGRAGLRRRHGETLVVGGQI